VLTEVSEFIVTSEVDGHRLFVTLDLEFCPLGVEKAVGMLVLTGRDKNIFNKVIDLSSAGKQGSASR